MKPDPTSRLIGVFVRHMINGDFAAMLELSKQINVNTPVEPANRTTALHRLSRSTIIQDPAEMAKFMIEELGSKPDQADADGNTPMHYAAENTQDHSLATYLSKVSNINATNKLGRTPIMAAAYSGSMQNVIALARLDADLDVKDTTGKSLTNIIQDAMGEEGANAFEQILIERAAGKAHQATVVVEKEDGSRSVEVNGIKVDIDISIVQAVTKPKRRL